jgi:hypothetical protein
MILSAQYSSVNHVHYVVEQISTHFLSYKTETLERT